MISPQQDAPICSAPAVARRRAATPGAALVALACATAATAQLFPPAAPPENPVTTAKANLGKVLFWDEQLSSTRTVACGTCHIPTAGGGDPRSTTPPAIHPGPDGLFGGDDDVAGSPGVPRNTADGLYEPSTSFGLAPQVTNRRTGTTINAAYASSLFWDGRAAGEFVDPVTSTVVIASGGALESQAVGPPVSDVEMGHVGRDWPEVLARIADAAPLALSPSVPDELLDWIAGRSYPTLFAEAFGSADITAPRVAMAIASHQRTLYTDQTPFDDYLWTGEGLTAAELAGRSVFAGAGQCDNCHQNAILSDHAFHYTGVRPKSDDPGREAVTNDPADEGKMRTPTLRNVALRAPYMHNGRLASLEEVIDFYDREGDFGPNELEGAPIDLTAQQKSDLLAFLGRPLTDPRLAEGLPPFDRPTLFAESHRAPATSGDGVAGSGGSTPAIVALEPPLIGNPSFTVAVRDALGGAAARLVIDDVDPGGVPPAPGTYFADTEITLGGVGNGAGYGSVSIAIPADPGLDGDRWFGRWYVTDPGATGGTAVSRLLTFRTFLGALPRGVFAAGFETGDDSEWSASAP